MTGQNQAQGVDDLVSFALTLRPSKFRVVATDGEGRKHNIHVSADVYSHDKLALKEVSSLNQLVEKFEAVRPIFEASDGVSRTADSYVSSGQAQRNYADSSKVENSKIIKITRKQFELARIYGERAITISNLYNEKKHAEATKAYDAFCAQLASDRTALLHDFETRADLETAVASYGVGSGDDPTVTQGTYAVIVYIGVEAYVIF